MQGAVVVSRDGSWPEAEEDVERIVAALDRCGFKPWELKVTPLMKRVPIVKRDSRVQVHICADTRPYICPSRTTE